MCIIWISLQDHVAELGKLVEGGPAVRIMPKRVRAREAIQALQRVKDGGLEIGVKAIASWVRGDKLQGLEVVRMVRSIWVGDVFEGAEPYSGS